MWDFNANRNSIAFTVLHPLQGDLYIIIVLYHAYIATSTLVTYHDDHVSQLEAYHLRSLNK